jgi:hypothetical protein
MVVALLILPNMRKLGGKGGCEVTICWIGVVWSTLLYEANGASYKLNQNNLNLT